MEPQVWGLSRLCPETSKKLYVHEFGFWIQLGKQGLFISLINFSYKFLDSSHLLSIETEFNDNYLVAV
jgi:hypothetical protein